MWKKVGIPAFCVGTVATFFVPVPMTISMLMIAGVLLLLAAWWCWRMRTTTWLFGVLIAASLGAAYAYARTQYALSQQWTAAAQSQPFDIVITGIPEMPNDKQTRFIAQATHVHSKKTYRLLLNDYGKRDWQVGQHWRINARVRTPIGTRNRVGFDREAWALANGIDGLASVGKERFRLPEHSFVGFNAIRAKIVQNWQSVSLTYPQGAALMKTLSVGDDSGLSREAWAAFRPLGLHHLISISGLHISMIALLVAWLSNKIMRLYTPNRPRVWALLIGWLAAVGYTGLAGFETPALRSLLMLSMFAYGWVARQQYSSWQIWWMALAAVLLYQPMAVLAVGFWLSFGLVAALLWVLSFRLPELGERNFWQHRRLIIKQAITAQWSATLIGGVATIALFGLLPVFSPLVNAVAIPFFSWLLTPLALLASFLPFDFLKIVAAWLGEHTINLLIHLGRLLPERSFAHAPHLLFGMAIGAALMILLPNGLRLKPLAMVLLAAFVLYRPAPITGSLKATVWDVGQGLSVLIQTPTQNILYDTGTPTAEFALLPNLRAANIRQLDTLILSHHDDDHDGGFEELKKSIKIKKIYAGQPEFYPQAQPCDAGTHWQIDGVQFAFFTLANHSQKNIKDNDLSCVLRISTPHQSILLTGDISKQTENQLIEQYGKKLNSNILILAHHGSKSSSGSSFLRTVAPQTAVASSGFANSFRHPHPDVQKMLAALNIQLLRTDLQGGIVFHFTDQGILYQLIAQPKYWWQRKPFSFSSSPNHNNLLKSSLNSNK